MSVNGTGRGPAHVDAVQAEAVRRAGLNLYTRPHEDKRPPAFDWGSTRPTCSGCGQKSSEVGSDGLCPTCRAPARGDESANKIPPRVTSAAPSRPRPSSTAHSRQRIELSRERVVELYDRGLTMPEVAGELGVSHSTINRFMDREGIPRRPPQRRVKRAKPAPAIAEQREDDGRRCPKCGASAQTAEPGAPTQQGMPVLVCGQCGAATLSSKWTDEVLVPEQVTEREDTGPEPAPARPAPARPAVAAHQPADRRAAMDECDELLSRAQIAERLGIPYKSVTTIMRQDLIEARKGQSGHQDGAVSLKQRMADLGVTSAVVRAWARETGRQVSDRGLPAADLVEAYAEAQQ